MAKAPTASVTLKRMESELYDAEYEVFYADRRIGRVWRTRHETIDRYTRASSEHTCWQLRGDPLRGGRACRSTRREAVAQVLADELRCDRNN